MSDFTDEDVTAATKAVHAWDDRPDHEHIAADPSVDDWCESVSRAVLAAVLPAHDRRVRAEGYVAGYRQGHHNAGHDDDDLPCDCFAIENGQS